MSRIAVLVAVSLLAGLRMLWFNSQPSAYQCPINSVPYFCSADDLKFFVASQLDSALTEKVPQEDLKPIERLILLVWQSGSAVYITPGPDGAPGEQGVDDDGDGVVDNLSELGGTGTDDRVVTPADGEAYQNASADKFAQIVSRGAMVPIWSSSDPNATPLDQLKIETPTEVRIDFVDQQGKLHSRFVELH